MIAAGRFWVDERGNTICVRLPNDDSPEKHTIEATVQEQVLTPSERGVGYIPGKGAAGQKRAISITGGA